MLDPAPSSPTISTISSSDLESASTGSFFHDRSTTLGTLMGVTSFAFNAPSQRRREIGVEERRQPKQQRRWWRGLCRDGVVVVVGESRRRNSASLGEFLEVERRFSEEAFYGGTVSDTRVLFDEGRVRPPARHHSVSNGAAAARFRASITGICSRAIG